MRADTRQVINQFKVTLLGNKKLIENVESMVEQEEKILYLSPTNATLLSPNYKKKQKVVGAIVLTDKRIILYSKTLDNYMEILPLEKVNTIKCSVNGITGGKAEVFGETQSISFLANYKAEVMSMIQATFANAINNYKEGIDKTKVNSEGIVEKNNYINDIRELKSLLDDGIINEDEFEIKKKELLGI
jgi:hypothetical protein